MALNQQLLQEILVQMRADGQGVADRAAQELARLRNEVAANAEGFASGSMSAEDFASKLRELGGDVSQWTKILQTSTEAARQLDTGFQEIQQKLQQYSERDKQNAQEAIALRGQVTRDSIEQYQRTVQAAKDASAQEVAERAAVQQKLQEYAERDKQRAAEDAAMRGQSTRAAVEQYNQTVQAAKDAADEEIANVAAIHAKLQEYAERDKQRAADDVAMRGQSTRAAVNEANAWKQGESQRQALNDAIRLGAAQEQQAIALTDVEVAAIQRKNSVLQQGTDRYGNFAFSVLATGHAIQDLTSANGDLTRGFQATINNIPLLVTGWSTLAGVAPHTAMAVAGITTAVAALGFAAVQSQGGPEQLATNLGLIDDPARKAADSIQELKDKIEILEKRPHKVAIDYQDLEKSKEKLEDLEKALSAYKRAKDQMTSVQEKAAKAVGETIAERAGGTDQESGAENLVKILLESWQKTGRGMTQDREYEKLQRARSNLASAQEALKFGSADEREVAMADVSKYSAEETRLSNEIKARLKERAEKTVGRALEAQDAAIREIQRAKSETPDFFDKGDKGKGITPVSPLFDLELERSRIASIRQQQKDEADYARQAQMAKLTETQRKKKEQDEQKEAREQDDLWRNAGTDEEGRTLEASNRAAKTARLARERQAKQRLDQLASQYGSGKLGTSLEESGMEMVARNQGAPKVEAGIRGRAVEALRASAVPEEVIGPVADRMAAEIMQRLRENLAAEGGPPIQAARAIVGRQNEKVDRADQLANRRAQSDDKQQAIASETQALVQNRGWRPQVARKVAERTQAHMDAGLPYPEASVRAEGDVTRRLQGPQPRQPRPQRRPAQHAGQGHPQEHAIQTSMSQVQGVQGSILKNQGQTAAVLASVQQRSFALQQTAQRVEWQLVQMRQQLPRLGGQTA